MCPRDRIKLKARVYGRGSEASEKLISKLMKLKMTGPKRLAVFATALWLSLVFIQPNGIDPGLFFPLR
jgi:hypothetical protein